MIVNSDTFMPILGIRAGDVPQRVLLVGDPARAERAAKRLDDARELARSREYVSFGGTFAVGGKANGGTNAGGCSTGAGVMPLLLLAFAFRRARKQVRKDS